MGADGSTVAALPPASIVLAPLATTVQVGGHFVVDATVRTSTGSVLTGRTLTWRSSAPTVASVTSTGAVTALSPGSAVVTASDGRSEEHTSELQSHVNLVCRLLLEK